MFLMKISFISDTFQFSIFLDPNGKPCIGACYYEKLMQMEKANKKQGKQQRQKQKEKEKQERERQKLEQLNQFKQQQQKQWLEKANEVR